MSTRIPAPPADHQRRGRLRGVVDGMRRTELTTSQKLMVFVLSMSLFGLSNIILEIVPDPSIGPVDISVSNMIFVPLAMAALLSPFWAALGAPLGEIVFTDLLMGDFSGLAEIEGYLQMFLAIYIGGSLVRNPRS
ncbi:MAG TPA: cell division protein FtsQ, partial [Brachybacterium sp.]|nr:cell division protein FtsQ [Brachybacterium sp.]